MEDSGYLFIRPHEMRKRYTEYVMQNKARAMLPSRTMLRRSTIKKKGTGATNLTSSKIDMSVNNTFQI